MLKLRHLRLQHVKMSHMLALLANLPIFVPDNELMRGRGPLFFLLMTELKTSVTNWLEAALQESPYFLVNVSASETSGKIAVEIDGDAGVQIGQCVELSRLISGKLEELYGDEHPYSIEIASAGADSPLKMFRQYKQHVGRDLDIKLKDGSELAGKFKELNGEELLMVENQKDRNKKTIGKEHRINFNDIQHANVIIKFK